MEDRFSALPDDLLVKILLLVPTKTAVATAFFSKRWRFVWTMVPKLEFKDTVFDKRERLKRWRRFIIKSVKLHKEPVIETLCIQLGKSDAPPFFLGVDFGKWIKKAVDRHVRVLEFELLRSDMLINMPTSLYTCKTLVELSLSTSVFVDVPSSACLPSLKRLLLVSVVYKDEHSLGRLLSSCSVLARSTIRFYIYDQFQQGTISIKNLTLAKDVPYVHIVCRAGYNILRSLPLATSLTLYQKFHVAASFSGITFSRLQRFELVPIANGWSNQLLLFLDESPNLRFLLINSFLGFRPGVLPLSRHQPSFVPRCLSSHVHNFEWKEYRGPEEERELVRYIFANSGCLKKATFTLRDTLDPEEKDKKVNDLKSFSRVSQMSQLLFK